MVAPQRYTFVMEQTLGHIPYGQNLRRTFEQAASVELDWLPIKYGHEGWTEQLPVLKQNWALRASRRAHQTLKERQKSHGLSDLYLFHTQSVALMAAPAFSHVRPVIVSLDATPTGYDRVGAAYGHNPGPAKLEQFKHYLYRRAFRAAHHLTTWSEWARQSLINEYGVDGERVTVIPPGTHLAYWQPIRRAEASGRKLNLLFVGGDFERKGGRLLYETFRQHLSDRYDLHLVTKGQVQAGNGVHVYSDVAPNSPALQALFAQADVFVLPTEGDCLPVAITEAMAAGLPVVSTTVGAIEEAVVNGSNGFAIRPGDGAALTAALSQLADDSGLRIRLGQAGRALAEGSFDAARNGQKLLALCQNLVNQAATSALTA